MNSLMTFTHLALDLTKYFMQKEINEIMQQSGDVCRCHEDCWQDKHIWT